MKFAVFVPADQTICYLTLEGMMTTVHREAALFDTHHEACKLGEQNTGKWESFQTPCSTEWRQLAKGVEDVTFFVEEIKDVEEFAARENTW